MEDAKTKSTQADGRLPSAWLLVRARERDLSPAGKGHTSGVGAPAFRAAGAAYCAVRALKASTRHVA